MVLETISPQQRNRVHPKGMTMKICILKVSPIMKPLPQAGQIGLLRIDIKDAPQKEIGQVEP
jgi:hypothetical protein